MVWNFKTMFKKHSIGVVGFVLESFAKFLKEGRNLGFDPSLILKKSISSSLARCILECIFGTSFFQLSNFERNLV